MADRCKYEKYQYQVSYNSGATWENVTPIQVRKGDITEYMSLDCSEIETLYRWVDLQGTYLCDGNNKYTREIQEESYDDGVTWYASYPTVYRQGTFVGVDEIYCADKFEGHYTYDDRAEKCGIGYFWNGYDCALVDPLKVVKCNDNTTLTSEDTKYYTNKFTLSSGKIGNCVTAIGNYAFDGCSYLSSVTIPDSVTSIGLRAFYYCNNLTNINIPNSVTSIGVSAFEYCTSLTSIDIPSGVTSINNETFAFCYSLTNIVIPDSITSIGSESFYKCTSLSSCTIGSGTTSIGNGAFKDTYITELVFNASMGYNAGIFNKDTLNSVILGNCVTSIGTNAFANCFSLSSVTIGSGVTSIGYAAFRSCKSLTSIDIPDSVTSIENSAFYNCSGLTSIDIPDSVTNIGNYAFYYCTNLTSIDIPSAVTSIGGSAFAYCKRLMSINIPDSVTSIGGGAFEWCSGLTSVTIGSGITNIDNYVFDNCRSITSITINATTPPTIGSDVFYGANNCPIYVPCNSVDTYKTASGWSDYADRISCKLSGTKFIATYNEGETYSAVCDTFTELTTATTKPRILEYSAMTSAVIGDCVTAIGNNAFSSGTSLSSCTIGSGVTSIGNRAFYSATSLTNIDLPSGVTSIGDWAFTYCSGLTNIDIPSGITSIGGGAFVYCTSLTSVTVNATTPPTLGSTPFSYTNDCPIYVPCESVTTYRVASNWNAYASRIFGIPPCSLPTKFRATYNDSRELIVDCLSTASTLTSSDTQPRGYKASAMTSAYIGDCVTSIGDNCFSGCTGLTSIDIPSGVTSIGSHAFTYCKSLTSIDIPSGVTSIGNYAFNSCTSLSSITINSTTPPTLELNNFAFGSTNNCPIYVPAASVDTYKTASGWSTYASRIQAIPT